MGAPQLNSARTPLAGLCLAVIVVLVLVAIAGATHFGEPARALEGFWAGDPAFLAEAGLADMFLTLEPAGRARDPRFRRYAGYLFMATPQGVICNQAVEVSFEIGLRARRQQVYEGRARATPDDADEFPLAECNDAGRAALRFALSPQAGSLALKQDGELRAFFFKDCGASAAVRAELADDAD